MKCPHHHPNGPGVCPQCERDTLSARLQLAEAERDAARLERDEWRQRAEAMEHLVRQMDKQARDA